MEKETILKKIESDLASLEGKAAQLQLSFQGVYEGIAKKIKDILVEKGVFDQVHAFELEREQFRKATEEKLQGLKEKALDLVKMRDYVRSLSEEAPTSTPEVSEPPQVSPAETVVKASRIRPVPSKVR